MRFAAAAAVAGLAAVANAGQMPSYPQYPTANLTTAPVYVTEVVTAFTTYCPSATAIEHGGVTYTITEATTLTITNCPCTLTRPVYTSVVTSCSTCTPTPMATMPPYPSPNATMPVQPPSTATGAYVPPANTGPVGPVAYTGAASKASYGAAGLLVAAGLLAAL